MKACKVSIMSVVDLPFMVDHGEEIILVHSLWSRVTVGIIRSNALSLAWKDTHENWLSTSSG